MNCTGVDFLFTKKQRKKKWLGRVLLCLVLIIAYFQNFFSFLEYKLEDRLYQSPGLIDQRIVVIGIDEKTVTEMGPFQQWSRQTMADAITILNSSDEGKPAVIAVDVLFAGESNNKEADANLVNAAKTGGNVVLASQAFFGQDMNGGKYVKILENPFDALAEHTRYGLANGTMDETDSVVRNAFLQTKHEGEIVRSFAYEIYREYTGNDSIPALADDSELFITYSGYPRDFSWGPSFSDLFADDFDPGFFADSIVIIGPYASAMMDAYYTPIDSRTQMFGVEIHANVVQMLLEENFKHRVPDSINFLIFLSMLLLGIFLMSFLEVRVLLFSFVALSGGFVFAALQLFARGHIIQLLFPIVTLLVLYLYHTIVSYVYETLEKKRVQNTLRKYVDPDIADRLIEMGDAQGDEVGKQRDIAVLFVDIRGFTTMSEALKEQPEQIVEILNEYLEHTSNCVFQNGGSIDKFIGDATMALFNGFAPLDDYVFKAVKTALDIVQGTQELNAMLLSKYNVEVGFGVGIQCGEAIVGNLGPTFRKDYTAIGDTVNTAARLESISLKSQILISQEVYERLGDRIKTEDLGAVQLKGKSKHIQVYAVTGISEEVLVKKMKKKKAGF